MLHTIIDPCDIFYNSRLPKYSEEKIGSGIMTMIMENGKYKPHSFFSTDPADYLTKIQGSFDPCEKNNLRR